MPDRRRKPNRRRAEGSALAEHVLQLPDTSVLDLLDHVLNKGVNATGDLTLGVAGVDLIYVRLSALLCAADRVMPRPSFDRGAPAASRRSKAVASRPAPRERRR